MTSNDGLLFLFTLLTISWHNMNYYSCKIGLFAVNQHNTTDFLKQIMKARTSINEL